MPDLQHLNLESCAAVRDGVLDAVAVGCPSLDHFAIEGCRNVTKAGAAPTKTTV